MQPLIRPDPSPDPPGSAGVSPASSGATESNGGNAPPGTSGGRSPWSRVGTGEDPPSHLLRADPRAPRDDRKYQARLPELVPIPGGDFVFRVEHRVREGRCPLFDHGPRLVTLRPYALGRYPVTNDQYAAFLRETGYRPDDAHNFLRHWIDGAPPPGMGDHPVVWVSPDDAEAYARWAGLRLPTEEEWQWAAQGPAARAWPWGDRFEEGRCNGSGAGTSRVAAFPDGASPFGCMDMAGNTWEWTAPAFDDGGHRWRLLRGGSYYEAQGSVWYTEGGPRPNQFHLRFLLLNDRLNRCATVGFRCASDATRDAR